MDLFELREQRLIRLRNGEKPEEVNKWYYAQLEQLKAPNIQSWSPEYLQEVAEPEYVISTNYFSNATCMTIMTIRNNVVVTFNR